jgi:hypothetical protein
MRDIGLMVAAPCRSLSGCPRKRVNSKPPLAELVALVMLAGSAVAQWPPPRSVHRAGPLAAASHSCVCECSPLPSCALTSDKQMRTVALGARMAWRLAAAESREGRQ